MRRLVTLAVVVASALISPTTASGQYTFGDWARDQGYFPGHVMPDRVWADNAGIDDLIDIGEFEWTATTRLYLYSSQISNLELDDFDGMTNLTALSLGYNQISSLELGVFSGLANLTWLTLGSNQISSLEPGAFSGLTNLPELTLRACCTLTRWISMLSMPPAVGYRPLGQCRFTV